MSDPVPSPADLDRLMTRLYPDVYDALADLDDPKPRAQRILAVVRKSVAAAVVSLTEHADTLRWERDNERNKAKAMTGIASDNQARASAAETERDAWRDAADAMTCVLSTNHSLTYVPTNILDKVSEARRAALAVLDTNQETNHD